MTIRNLFRLEAVALATLLIGFAGCSTPDRTSSQVMEDRRTARRVKKELDHAAIFKYPDVRINAFDGNIQLSGFVETEAQRQDAAQIAANVKGVKQVINGIMLKPLATGRTTIRDPLGQETGREWLDTNSPPRQLNTTNQPPANP